MLLVSTESLNHEPQMWMSLIGPPLVQIKSSAIIHGPLFQTSSPCRFGGWTYLTRSLVSIHSVGVLVGVSSLKAKSTGCIGPPGGGWKVVGTQVVLLPGKNPGHG